MPEVILDVVAKAGRDVSISDAITGGELERTITGASTLTIDLHDPHRTLIRSRDLQRAIDLQYAGVWFRLVRISKSDDTVTLTFEDRDVAYLRTHRRPRKVSRNKSTRAQFVRSLVREVKANRIDFYCPEVNERQPIGKTKEATADTSKRDKTKRDKDKRKGLPKDAGGLTVKGAAATPEQRRNGERVLDVADSLGAGPKATKALMEAVIIESQLQNLSGGDRDSEGVLQVRVSTSGSSARSRDIEWCVKQFLTKGFYTDPALGGGGAMKLAREHTGVSAGRIAQATQGSGVPDAYDTVADEADRWIEAYGGASGTDTGGTSTTVSVRRRYEFSRGKPGEREDSWTAIQRLAEEVHWRAFVDAGTLYFVSDERLMKSRARYTWTEDTAGVHYIDFDVDQGRVSSELRVLCRTDLFDVPVGCVVAIRDMGIANGRWLVTTVRQNLFGTDTEVTLTAPTPKLPEPETEISEKTIRSDTGDGATITMDGGKFTITTTGGAKGIVEQAAAIAARVGGSGVFVVSDSRPGSVTSSGNASDHSSNTATQAARDIAVRGIDAITGPPSPKLDAAVVAIGKVLGRDYGDGKKTIVDTFEWRGYRVQIIWRTPAYGGHMGHIHCGARRQASPTG